ncbi:MAG: NAD-dependent protein deacylase [Clostridia bacterium]|nr:NAD-dependent protein deacylase [Clostridia bacterium]
MDKLEQFRELLAQSGNVVFLTGAGISTASGLADFRGREGLEKRKSPVPYETLLSIDFFESDPETFYRYYKDFLIVGDAKPNVAHKAIAGLGDKVGAVVTQNIDGLHQLAGSRNVIEVHGTTLEYRCVRCGKRYPESYIKSAAGVPRCSCGGILRPDIIFYGESLDMRKLEKSIAAIRACDMLVVVGSSLVVYPAAGLVDYRGRNAKFVIINYDPTPYDAYADLVINEDISKVFASLDSD